MLMFDSWLMIHGTNTDDKNKIKLETDKRFLIPADGIWGLMLVLLPQNGHWIMVTDGWPPMVPTGWWFWWVAGPDWTWLNCDASWWLVMVDDGRLIQQKMFINLLASWWTCLYSRTWSILGNAAYIGSIPDFSWLITYTIQSTGSHAPQWAMIHTLVIRNGWCWSNGGTEQILFANVWRE